MAVKGNKGKMKARWVYTASFAQSTYEGNCQVCSDLMLDRTGANYKAPDFDG